MSLSTAPLFQPLSLRKVTLRNRIVMSPMTRGFPPEGVGIDHPSALGEAGLGENAIPVFHSEAALAGWCQVLDASMRRAGRFSHSCGTWA